MFKYNGSVYFKYKFWKVYIEEVFGTRHKLHFTIDSYGIMNACYEIIRKNNLQNNVAINKAMELSAADFAVLFDKAMESITVNHWGYRMTEKCKDDAIRHIDYNLGSAIDYVKDNNLLPKLGMFFL